MVFSTKAAKRITDRNDTPSTPLIKPLCHPKNTPYNLSSGIAASNTVEMK